MKKVTLETVKKGIQKHSGLHRSMHSKVRAPHCFICDGEIAGRGVPLLLGHTSYTKTGFPTKIGQLMGDGFMVVVSMEDMLCRRCSALLNHLDKLESDLEIVKRALTGYLKMKYGLLDDAEEQMQDEQLQLTNEKNIDEIPNLNPDGKTTDGEFISKDSGGNEVQSLHKRITKNRTVEILLDETSISKKNSQSQNDCKISRQDSAKMYKCSVCDLKISDHSAFQKHVLSCNVLPFKCSMCDKRFENNKYVRAHVMEVHLSSWICHFCDSSFNEEKEYTLHMKTHLVHRGNSLKPDKDELLAASSGDDSFNTQQNLQGSYECNICDYQCNSKKVFEEHVHEHVTSKPFQCKVCKKKCHDKETLSQHMQDHKQETVECQVCRVELDKNNFKEHMVTHEESASKQSSCDDKADGISGQKVNVMKKSDEQESQSNDTKNKEETNQLVENGSKEIEFHTCHICSLTFVNGSLFTEHIKMHTEEEPNKELFDTDATQLLNIRKAVLDEDSIMHYSNSSDLVERQQYVEMDESLEDMFEKLHGETAKEPHLNTESVVPSEEKAETNQEKASQDMVELHNCNISLENFENDNDPQIHKVSQMHIDTVSAIETNQMSLCVEENDGIVSLQGGLNQCTSEQNEVNILPAKEKTINVFPAHTVDSGSAQQNTAESTKYLPIQIVSSQNQKECNRNDFLSIFDMVRAKKMTSNDDAEIDHNFLQNICVENIKSEETEMSATPVANILPFVPPDVKHISDGILYSTPPNPSKKTYVCAMCGFRTPQMYELRKHFKEHKQKAFRCKVCYKVFQCGQKLGAHLRVHERFRGRMTCPYCYEEFPDKLNLQRHLQDKHQKEKIVYKCSFCNETFNTKKAYKVHEEIHPERFSFKCNECDQPFLKEKQLLDHRDAVHRDPHCRYCGKEITKAKTLRNHELRHIREKDSYECDMCKRVFKTKTGLRHHVAVHTGEYKYCCSYCGRGFMSRMMMEEHLSMHTKEERYICDVCGRKFSFQSTYWIHRKWHDNPYPYKCSFCGRMFRHSSLLAVHKRKHTGERPYKCPHCPLTFPVGGTLKRHLILHTGVYPFNCESCKRGFTTRHKYATHLAKIHGDFNMLHAKPQQNEFKMVIRDESSKPVEQPTTLPTVWEVANDAVADQMNFRLETFPGVDDTIKNTLGDGIACTIVSDDMLVDNVIPTRVVEIVLDEASQAVASVTLAEHANMLPDIWYQ